MGNSPSIATEEQNEAACREATEIFRVLDLNDQSISKDEWERAFAALDINGDGSVSRKEWYLKQGTTEMFDAIFKKSTGNLTREEWGEAFERLDTDGDGFVSIAEWSRRRKVRIAFFPLGMTINNWGVAVGDNFYEVLSTNWQQTEMVVAGPDGIIAMGESAREERAKEEWVQGFKGEIEQGKKPEGMWHAEKSEPRSRPEEVWKQQEIAGWTMKTDEEIEAWIFQWVEENPVFKALDAIGRECNDQTFALAFISWLTNSRYERLTDNTKGRAVVYGGLALLASAGAIYLTHRMTRPKAEAEAEELPSRLPSQTRHEGRRFGGAPSIVITDCREVRSRRSQPAARQKSCAPAERLIGGMRFKTGQQMMN